MVKKIIFSSGGTGGHILPAVNLMKYFSKKGFEVILVTDYKGSKFVKNNSDFKSYIISADTPLNKKLVKKIFSLFVIIYSLIKSFFILGNKYLLARPNIKLGSYTIKGQLKNLDAKEIGNET